VHGCVILGVRSGLFRRCRAPCSRLRHEQALRKRTLSSDPEIHVPDKRSKEPGGNSALQLMQIRGQTRLLKDV